MTVRFATSTWTLLYIAYLLDPNWRHLLCTMIIYVAYLFKVDFPMRRYMRKEWKSYISDSDKYFSVRHYLEKMMLNREIQHAPQMEWGSAHYKHWYELSRVPGTGFLALLYIYSLFI